MKIEQARIRHKVAEFARELRSIPIVALSIRERNQAIRSHVRRYLKFLFTFKRTNG